MRNFPANQALQLLIAKFVFRSRQFSHKLYANVRLGGLIQIKKASLPLFANPHQALILDDTVQPGGKCPLAPKLREALEGLPAGILHFVLRVGGIVKK